MMTPVHKKGNDSLVFTSRRLDDGSLTLAEEAKGDQGDPDSVAQPGDKAYPLLVGT